jgi:hypothetical protein
MEAEVRAAKTELGEITRLIKALEQKIEEGIQNDADSAMRHALDPKPDIR